MIQKNTYVYPVDKSGALLGKVFHTYKGSKKKICKVGEFIKISLRRVKPDIKLKKKQKTKALIIRSNYKSTRLDGSFFFFYENSVILVKRKLITRSNEFVEAGDRMILRKKLLHKFPGIL